MHNYTVTNGGCFKSYVVFKIFNNSYDQHSKNFRNTEKLYYKQRKYREEEYKTQLTF